MTDTGAASSSGLTQAERTAISDARLLDAAIELVCTSGPAQTTLKALGEASGYSRGLVTYRFGSKAGLFESLIHAVSTQWVEQLRRAIGELRGLDAVKAAADAYFQFVLDAPRPIRAMNILFCDAAMPNSPLADTVARITARRIADVEHWLRDGQLTGSVIDTINPHVEAVRFIAYVQGMTTLWLVSPGTMPYARAHKANTEHLLRTYSPGSTAPRDHQEETP